MSIVAMRLSPAHLHEGLRQYSRKPSPLPHPPANVRLVLRWRERMPCPVPMVVAVRTSSDYVVAPVAATLCPRLKMFSRTAQALGLPRCESVSGRETTGILKPDR
jgi:hypothetical protein